jgi:glycosyltransferase involved in cell wall biosynthesis
MPRLLVISFSDLASDPRVDRQIDFLRARYDIVTAGTGPSRHEVDRHIDISTPTRSLPGRVLGLARLLARRYEDVFWKHPSNLEVLRRLVHVEPDVIVANDLASLPIALRLGPPVVFDAHEYAPREFEEVLWWRVVMKPFVAWQSRRYIPRVAAMTTVGEAIADEYAREAGVRATVVTNAPRYANLAPSPVHHPIRVLHHGGAMSGRGLEEMIHLAKLLDDRFETTFVLVDTVPGNAHETRKRRRYHDALKRHAKGHHRIRFLPPQPMETLAQMANAYDIGLYLLRPANFNARFALPNKFFEFIQGRLAVAIGPSPEMARIVRENGLGIVAEDFAPETLAAALNDLDLATITAFKHAAESAAAELCAERNAEIMTNVVGAALAATAGLRDEDHRL